MKNTILITFSFLESDLKSELIYWECDGQGVGSHFLKESIPFRYDDLYQQYLNLFGIPAHEDDSRLLTIYTYAKGTVKFVFRNGNTLLCVIKEKDLTCGSITNLLYDKLKVCQRSLTSETITEPSSLGTVSDTIEGSTKFKVVLIVIAVVSIAIICIALVVAVLIILLKKLCSKKEPSSDGDESRSGGTWPFDFNSGPKTESTSSDSVSSKQLLI